MSIFLPSHIKYTSTVGFGEDQENYLTTITGSLICCEETSEREFEAGQITAFYLDLSGAYDNRYAAMDIFDLHQEAYDQYEALFDHETGEIKDEILATHGPDVPGRNWLILNRLEIRPKFRGRGLGLAAIYRTMQQFGHGCAFISLDVAPLQVERREGGSDKERWFTEMKMDSFTTDIPQATQRLKDYYGILGFQEVTGTNMMLLNPAYQQPIPFSMG